MGVEYIAIVIAAAAVGLTMGAFGLQIRSNKQILQIQQQISAIDEELKKMKVITVKLERLSDDMRESEHNLSKYIVAMS